MKPASRILAFSFIFMCGMSGDLHSAEPRTLEEALLNYSWEWSHAPKPPDLLIFTKDGMAKCERFSWHWKITGDHAALGYDATMHDTGKRIENFKAEMTFDSDFRTLQAQTPEGKIRFTGRRLGLNSVPAPVLAPVIAFQRIQTDPSQPRITVIKDQGPNATEWVLTSLDVVIPADIRQNLIFLREDLLDESAGSAPKAAPEAYKLASDYCDKILAALDQRDLARVNAGYSAAQADSGKRTSTQVLDARRNYQMSWPQYAREESQRAALRENESDKADVKKERLKVDWTTRCVRMRAHLDDIYSRLRSAMR